MVSMIADDAEHAGLGGLHADVGGHRLDLAGDDVQGNLVKTLDTDRVLHRHGGDGDQPVHAEHREGARSAWMPAPPPESDPAMVITPQRRLAGFRQAVGNSLDYDRDGRGPPRRAPARPKHLRGRR